MTSTALATLTSKLAATLDMGDGTDLVAILKNTAFKGDVSDAQMTALMVVANQYGLNPWTKEIYAFPDKKAGIVPVVGVDGWSRIINDNPMFDGMDFRVSDTMVTPPGAKAAAPEWMECVIHRKDRSRPIVVREYLDEVYRAPFKTDKGYVIDGPWQSHPKRFLRHKVMIQCARIAFGFGGIYDPDEAERIAEAKSQEAKDMGMAAEVKPEFYPENRFTENLPKWHKMIDSGVKTVDDIIATVQARHPLTEQQKAEIRKQPQAPKAEEKQPAAPLAPPVMTYAVVADRIHKAGDDDALSIAGDLIGAVESAEQRVQLISLHEQREAELRAHAKDAA